MPVAVIGKSISRLYDVPAGSFIQKEALLLFGSEETATDLSKLDKNTEFFLPYISDKEE